MQNTYGQIDAKLRVIRSRGQNYVRLRAIKSSGEECQPTNANPKAQIQTESGDEEPRPNQLLQNQKPKLKTNSKTVVIKLYIQLLTSLMNAQV